MNIRRFGKGRLVRAVALLFLFHSGVDLLFPQLCTEEPVSITVKESLPVSEGTINDQTSAIIGVSLPSVPGEDQRPDPTRDEDCFCCCTHVMASQGFVNQENAELKLPTGVQPEISILSAPPNNPYHPPRLA